MNDSDIIRNVLNGDQNKYSLIVEKYQSNVFRTVMGFVHQKENAEEITQDVFVKAYYSLKSFQGRSAFNTWLYRITVNLCLNFLNKKKRRKIWSLFTDSFQLPMKEKFVITQMEEAEEFRIVQKAIDSLSEKQRTAFVLSKYEELSQKQIASVMNITEGAVEQLLQRAKINLKKKLNRHVGK